MQVRLSQTRRNSGKVGVLNLFNILPEKQGLYRRYLKAVQPLLARHSARVLFYGKARIVCAGVYTQEYCGLVLYPDAQTARNLSADPDFKTIRPWRDESTSDFKIVVLDETVLD